jgi:LCP family protein required for cell wall assembly
MADESDGESFERYFRPRPGTQGGENGPDGTGGFGVSDDGEPAGVAIDDTRAPRVSVPAPRSHRRPDGPGVDSRAPRRSLVSARRQRRFLLISAVMSGFVLVTSGGAWAFQAYITGSIDKVGVGGLGKGKNDGPKGAMNILVAGVDRREGLTKAQQQEMHLGHEPGERSDTMMLVHVSADHDKISIVSLPRDSYVMIPAHKSNGSEGAKNSQVPARYGKLTWAYQFGGPDLTVATIKSATGVAIDHYIEVNFFGFVKMVDALGGVDICTEQAINDPKSGLQLSAGKHPDVGGVKALGFARARYTLGDGTDLGRIDRQQQFMSTMMKKALSSNTLSDPIKSAKFLSAALKAVRVDKGLAKNMPALADQMKSLSTDSVAFAKVPLSNPGYNVVMWNIRQPQSTVLWDNRAAADLFAHFKKDQPLIKPTPTVTPGQAQPQAKPKPKDDLTVSPAQITVRVLNGVGTRGVARQSANDLRRAGFVPVVVPGIAKTTGMKTTQIQYGPGREDSAKTLAAAIPGAKVKKVASLGNTIQVLVGGNWAGAKKVKLTAAAAAATGAGQQPAARTATQNILCK